jgi:hypothetical protein
MYIGLLSGIERQTQFAAQESQLLPPQFGHSHALPTLVGLPQGREDQFQAGPLGGEMRDNLRAPLASSNVRSSKLVVRIDL